MKNIIIDTRTIIINLLKEDETTYTSMTRLQMLISYIYNELTDEHKLDDYITYFEVNFDAIERTVRYNNNIFKLDIDGDMIYLRKSISISDLVSKYSVDDYITNIIKEFRIKYAA